MLRQAGMRLRIKKNVEASRHALTYQEERQGHSQQRQTAVADENKEIQIVEVAWCLSLDLRKLVANSVRFGGIY